MQFAHTRVFSIPVSHKIFCATYDKSTYRQLHILINSILSESPTAPSWQHMTELFSFYNFPIIYSLVFINNISHGIKISTGLLLYSLFYNVNDYILKIYA